MRRWECTRFFVLIEDTKLSREAESHLTRQHIRFVGNGQNGEQAYVHHCFVETERSSDAIDDSREILDGLLAPYKVAFLVYDTQVRVVGAVGNE
jgi:hypothetical protein